MTRLQRAELALPFGVIHPWEISAAHENIAAAIHAAEVEAAERMRERAAKAILPKSRLISEYEMLNRLAGVIRTLPLEETCVPVS